MEYRTVGKTGLDVSAIGFGAAPIAGLYREVPESEAVATIQAALDRGINYFDTAPAYGRGLSEQRLGLVLPKLPRESFVVSTKIGRLIDAERNIIRDYSRDGVLRSLEASLNLLQLDYVDIVHIHDPDHHYEEAIGQAYPALDELRDQGVIKAVSVGINQWQILMDFVRDGDFDCFMLANSYHLLQFGALPLLDLCAEKRIGILLAGVYATGILATGAVEGAKFRYRDASPEILERVRQIESICARFDVPLKAVALQFGMGHPAISSLVLGMSTPQRIGDNIEALAAPIPAEFWTALREEGVVDEAVPLP
jgi:D-threo-aldose 1-dehydrogenase